YWAVNAWLEAAALLIKIDHVPENQYSERDEDPNRHGGRRCRGFGVVELRALRLMNIWTAARLWVVLLLFHFCGCEGGVAAPAGAALVEASAVSTTLVVD